MTWLNCQVLGGAFDSKYLDAGKWGNQPSLAWIIEITTKKESCLDVYRLKSYIEGIEYQMDLLNQPQTNVAVYVTLSSSQLQTPEADCEFVTLLFVFSFFFNFNTETQTRTRLEAFERSDTARQYYDFTGGQTSIRQGEHQKE